MKTIKNTTPRPLRVPLPRGGTLHLGPKSTGEVTPSALEHPPFKKLVESGEIEVTGDGERGLPHPVKREQVAGRGRSHTTTAIKQSGDR